MQQNELDDLRQRLQQTLQQQVSPIGHLQVRCAVRQETLLVLVEHLLHVEPDPQDTFRVLEQSIQQLAPEFKKFDFIQSPSGPSQSLPIRFYLRIAGYQQPYAFQPFTLDLLSIPANGSATWTTEPVNHSSSTVSFPTAPIGLEPPEIASSEPEPEDAEPEQDGIGSAVSADEDAAISPAAPAEEELALESTTAFESLDRDAAIQEPTATPEAVIEPAPIPSAVTPFAANLGNALLEPALEALVTEREATETEQPAAAQEAEEIAVDEVDEIEQDSEISAASAPEQLTEAAEQSEEFGAIEAVEAAPPEAPPEDRVEPVSEDLDRSIAAVEEPEELFETAARLEAIASMETLSAVPLSEPAIEDPAIEEPEPFLERREEPFSPLEETIAPEAVAPEAVETVEAVAPQDIALEPVAPEPAETVAPQDIAPEPVVPETALEEPSAATIQELDQEVESGPESEPIWDREAEMPPAETLPHEEQLSGSLGSGSLSYIADVPAPLEEESLAEPLEDALGLDTPDAIEEIVAALTDEQPVTAAELLEEEGASGPAVADLATPEAVIFRPDGVESEVEGDAAPPLVAADAPSAPEQSAPVEEDSPAGHPDLEEVAGTTEEEALEYWATEDPELDGLVVEAIAPLPDFLEEEREAGSQYQDEQDLEEALPLVSSDISDAASAEAVTDVVGIPEVELPDGSLEELLDWLREEPPASEAVEAPPEAGSSDSEVEAESVVSSSDSAEVLFGADRFGADPEEATPAADALVDPQAGSFPVIYSEQMGPETAAPEVTELALVEPVEPGLAEPDLSETVVFQPLVEPVEPELAALDPSEAVVFEPPLIESFAASQAVEASDATATTEEPERTEVLPTSLSPTAAELPAAETADFPIQLDQMDELDGAAAGLAEPAIDSTAVWLDSGAVSGVGGPATAAPEAFIAPLIQPSEEPEANLEIGELQAEEITGAEWSEFDEDIATSSPVFDSWTAVEPQTVEPQTEAAIAEPALDEEPPAELQGTSDAIAFPAVLPSDAPALDGASEPAELATELFNLSEPSAELDLPVSSEAQDTAVLETFETIDSSPTADSQESTEAEAQLPVELTDETAEASDITEVLALPVPKAAAVDTADMAAVVPTETLADLAVAEPLHLAVSIEPEEAVRRAAKPSRFSTTSLVVGGSVGLFAMVSLVYVLTRPCVLGTCEPLRKAQQLSEEATQTVQNTNSALAVVEAHNQLNEASALLGAIPTWSSYYQQAQTLRATYDGKAAVLEQVVDALEQANAAAQKSLNPPHPLQQWREVQDHWRKAIAQVQSIPADSSVYPLAQRKLKEYQSSLANINQRVIIEQNAQSKVDAAKQTAQIAETRTGAANSADAWQQAYSTWVATIALLRQIPQGTMAYAEAQQLLAIYQPKLTTIAQQKTAANAYDQSLRLADQARALEQQNQWSEAVASWRDALTSIQQVATGTAYYNQAQSLVGSYTTALNQAEQTLRRSVAMQSVRPDLDRACAGDPRICTYTFGADAVRVQLTPDYDQAVEALMVNARLQGNYAASTNLRNQVGAFLRELARISENSQVPVELYNSDGSKFGTYAPDLSGFVQQ